ncbi:MAG: helix-turn-helix transcriptional regulator [Proteobacteria bacterium]|nr:helix-turn-helix transcriptional regulator [Pseudomonadota bacterium]
MLTHEDIWRAIDRFAQANGLSPSGLARRSGLDPTTFNKSKRITRDGKPRWPSTESLAKILAATGRGIADFVAFVGEGRGGAPQRRIPLIALALAQAPDAFDAEGRPAGGSWDEIPFPDLDSAAAFAVEIGGDGLTPVYRDGDVIVVVPGASLRRSDRVLVRTRVGEVLIMRLSRQSARRVELRALAGNGPARTLAVEDIAWMGRVVWASQ